MRLRGLLALAAVGALGACAGEPSQIQFGMEGTDPLLRSLLSIRATAGDWALVVEPSEMGTADAPRRSRAFDTPPGGDLTVTARLARPGQDPLASVSTELDIREDWIWTLDVFLADQNPTQGCFGCSGYAAVAVEDPTAAASGDSLFLVWSGNSISDPVIY